MTGSNYATQIIPYPAALDAAAVSVQCSNAMDHQLIIGNGDINALVGFKDQSLVVALSKNDIGDWRYDSTQDPEFVKISEIRKRGAMGEWKPPVGNFFAGKNYPVPLKALTLTIPLGGSAGNDVNTLDLRRGVARIRAKTGPESVVMCANAHPSELNIAVTSIPVFPSDEVTFFSPEKQKALFSHTIATSTAEGYNEWIMLPMAMARLSMPGAYVRMRQEFDIRKSPNGTLRFTRRADHRWNNKALKADSRGVLEVMTKPGERMVCKSGE